MAISVIFSSPTDESDKLCDKGNLLNILFALNFLPCCLSKVNVWISFKETPKPTCIELAVPICPLEE